MTVFQAVLFGFVYGAAEFIPISGAGHLIVLQSVFGVTHPHITFAITVQIGSLCAVFSIIYGDFIKLFKNPFHKLILLLVAGLIPAVLIGLLVKVHIHVFNQAFLLGTAFIFNGVLLLISDNIKHSGKSYNKMSFFDAVIIGCMQAAALSPGISRIGASLTGSLISGLDRETAARFSFLLFTFILIGSGLFNIINYADGLNGLRVYRGNIPFYMIGFVSAAVSSYFSIKLLLVLLNIQRLRFFAYYSFVMAALILIDRFLLNLFFLY